MKSIQKKIVLNSVILVGLSLIILGISSIVGIYRSAMTFVESNMNETVKVASGRVEWELRAYSNIATGLGAINRMSDPAVSDEDKLAIMNNWALRYGLQRCNLIDAEGNGIDGNDYADREYFQMAMQGKTHFSEPLVSKVTGKLTIIIAAPLYRGTEVAGCVYVVPDEEFLNDIVRDVSISENCFTYMIDKAGNVIAHPDMDVIKNGESYTAATPGYRELMEMREKMKAGETGYTGFGLDGKTVISAYCPVEGTNSWSIAIQAPQSDFMENTLVTILVVSIIAAVALTVAVLFSFGLGKSIGKPIKICTERIGLLSRGDLSSPVPQVKSKDETGILAEATSSTVQTLNSIINDIGRILGEMAEGNFNVNTRESSSFYTGDFRRLLEYMEKINAKLSETIYNIDIASSQVLMGAEHVSSAAQDLSQGTAEQASSVEELAATLRLVAEEVADTSNNCVKARDRVTESVSYVDEAIAEMEQLSGAMNHISETSDKIGSIIKAIEDIAFQTNILALNAAVEAAKAGDAGKGFAVVADEVRSLATKSADAAGDTTELIEQSIAAVTAGMDKAAATSAALQNVGKTASIAEDIVSRIAKASQDESDSLSQVDVGIDQISAVVQRNAATSQESAASAEELSSQANALKSLINAFKISKKEENE